METKTTSDYERICPCCGLKDLPPRIRFCPHCRAKIHSDSWNNIASFVSPFMSGIIGYMQFSKEQAERR